jgi:5-methylcytosine-specific restriction endonuclease McrA
MKPLLPYLAPLDDQALLAELPRLARSERSSTVELVARLVELDERRLYLAQGFPSLYAYCSSVLNLKEAEAYNRIEAARAVRRQPELLDRLADGSLSLTTLRLVAPHVSDSDKTLLDAASGKSRRQVEELVVARLPEQPPVSSVRKLPDLPPSRRPVVAPVSEDQYRITITASRRMKELLVRAQDLLRHQIPDGDPGEVLCQGLTVLVEQLERKKLGVAGSKRKVRPTRPGSRHIPAEVRRAVWERDGARCAFVARDGRRCAETGRIEFHHIDPYVLGGEPTVRNISLRCRSHNAYEAEAWFGHRKEAASSFRKECPSGSIA